MPPNSAWQDAVFPKWIVSFPWLKEGSAHGAHELQGAKERMDPTPAWAPPLSPPPTVTSATVLAAVVAGVAAAFRRHRLQPLATCSVVPAPLTAGPYCMAAAGATGEYIPASTCKASLTDRNAAQHARRFALVLATLVKRSYPQTHAYLPRACAPALPRLSTDAAASGKPLVAGDLIVVFGASGSLLPCRCFFKGGGQDATS